MHIIESFTSFDIDQKDGFGVPAPTHTVPTCMCPIPAPPSDSARTNNTGLRFLTDQAQARPGAVSSSPAISCWSALAEGNAGHSACEWSKIAIRAMQAFHGGKLYLPNGFYFRKENPQCMKHDLEGLWITAIGRSHRCDQEGLVLQLLVALGGEAVIGPGLAAYKGAPAVPARPGKAPPERAPLRCHRVVGCNFRDFRFNVAMKSCGKGSDWNRKTMTTSVTRRNSDARHLYGLTCAKKSSLVPTTRRDRDGNIEAPSELKTMRILRQEGARTVLRGHLGEVPLVVLAFAVHHQRGRGRKLHQADAACAGGGPAPRPAKRANTLAGAGALSSKCLPGPNHSGTNLFILRQNCYFSASNAQMTQ